MKLKIENKLIGKNLPVFVIAEAGVNHNGDINLAKKLIDVAKESGADAIKFQTFKAKNVVTKKTGMAEYQEKNTGKKESQQEMLKKFELSDNSFNELKKYCDDKNIIFLSTPHSEDAVDLIDTLIPAYKIGSGDLTNTVLLEKVAKKLKPMILGTGMSNMQEIKEAISTIKNQGNNKIIMLHCTTNYPCPGKNVNLNALQTMQKELDCIIGYSDHTLSTLTPALAVTLGAKVIEKHFTLDKDLPGPDHKASLTPEELTQTIQNIRYAEQVLGSKEKKPADSEKKILKLVRKSIVAAKNIPKDTVLSKELLIIKRPGTGIPPSKIKEVIGKQAIENIEEDELIDFEKLK